MPSCEKCWVDAGGDADTYYCLLGTRSCSPEEQAGEDATTCPKCKRRTVHHYARICMACGVDARGRAGGGTTP